MKNFLSGELLHENKINVKLNYGLLRKGQRIEALRKEEAKYTAIAQKGLNRVRVSRRGKLIGVNRGTTFLKQMENLVAVRVI